MPDATTVMDQGSRESLAKVMREERRQLRLLLVKGGLCALSLIGFVVLTVGVLLQWGLAPDLTLMQVFQRWPWECLWTLMLGGFAQNLAKSVVKRNGK